MLAEKIERASLALAIGLAAELPACKGCFKLFAVDLTVERPPANSDGGAKRLPAGGGSKLELRVGRMHAEVSRGLQLRSLRIIPMANPYG